MSHPASPAPIADSLATLSLSNSSSLKTLNASESAKKLTESESTKKMASSGSIAQLKTMSTSPSEVALPASTAANAVAVRAIVYLPPDNQQKVLKLKLTPPNFDELVPAIVKLVDPAGAASFTGINGSPLQFSLTYDDGEDVCEISAPHDLAEAISFQSSSKPTVPLTIFVHFGSKSVPYSGSVGSSATSAPTTTEGEGEDDFVTIENPIVAGPEPTVADLASIPASTETESSPLEPPVEFHNPIYPPVFLDTVPHDTSDEPTLAAAEAEPVAPSAPEAPEATQGEQVNTETQTSPIPLQVESIVEPPCEEPLTTATEEVPALAVVEKTPIPKPQSPEIVAPVAQAPKVNIPSSVPSSVAQTPKLAASTSVPQTPKQEVRISAESTQSSQVSTPSISSTSIPITIVPAVLPTSCPTPPPFQPVHGGSVEINRHKKKPVPIAQHGSRPAKQVHQNFVCDRCAMTPIVGDRYRCIQCGDYPGFDLCEYCIAIPGVHAHHKMELVGGPKPVPTTKPLNPSRHIVHSSVQCNDCRAYPIRGARYVCLDCPGQDTFDLCETCNSKNDHNASHRFIKFAYVPSKAEVNETRCLMKNKEPDYSAELIAGQQSSLSFHVGPSSPIDFELFYRNNGANSWPKDTTLMAVRSESFKLPLGKLTDQTRPGSIVPFKVSLVAPPARGKFELDVLLTQPSNKTFGAPLKVTIFVK